MASDGAQSDARPGRRPGDPSERGAEIAARGADLRAPRESVVSHLDLPCGGGTGVARRLSHGAGPSGDWEMRRAFAAALTLTIVVGTPAQAQDFDLSRLQLPPGFLDLSNLSITTRNDRTVTATAYTTLMNAGTFVLISSTPATTARRGFILGLKPDD